MRTADDLLTAGPWMLLDADNHRVGYAASAAEARRAVAAGRAATWAAIPRHGVTALDLDAPEALSWLAADMLTDWCRARGLWWLLRESGRAGHLHLWVYSGQLTDDLADYADAVRAELHLSRTQLDNRSTKSIRPPSAPHRSGAPALADQLTAEHLADLVRRLDGRSLAPRTRRAADPAAPDHTARRPRLRRRRAVAQDGAPTGDRSHDEFVNVTLPAYNAGLTADEAWQQVAALDGHSAERGRRWWQRCMWDRIVPPTGPERPQLVDAARGSLPAIRARLAVLPDLDTRQAHSLDVVLWVIGEHIGTTTEPQPVSERDVRGATGLARLTIRRALARAVAAGIIERHDPSRPDDALAWSVGPAMRDQLRENDPPCLTPVAPGWLHTLPRGSTTALTLHLAGQPLPPELAPLLPAILAVVQQGLAAQPVECPAWPSIRAERDTWHQAVRHTRAERNALWQAQRAEAHRRQRAHALAWKRRCLAQVYAARAARAPQPTLPRLDCLPSHPGRVLWTARATAPAHPAHSARSDHRPAHRPAHPSHPLARSGDTWTAPRTAPWTPALLPEPSVATDR